MDSRKPLTAWEIEELKEEISTMPHKEFFGENLQPLVDDHSRLLSIQAPPPDAAVREAVESIEKLNAVPGSARFEELQSNSRTVVRKLLEVTKEAQELRRAVQAPRLTEEQAFRLRLVYAVLKQHWLTGTAEMLCAAFPDLFAGEE